MNSDTAEEITFCPQLPFQDVLAHPAEAGIDEESVAALNLLSMNCRNLAETMAALQRSSPSLPMPLDFRQMNATTLASVANTALNRRGSSSAANENLIGKLTDVLKGLPKAKLLQLSQIKQELDSNIHQATAADTSVAHFAKVTLLLFICACKVPQVASQCLGQ